MLKRKITEAQFEALNEALKPEYKKDANGAYVLDADDAAELTATNARLREAEKQLKQSLTSTQAERDELAAKIEENERAQLGSKGNVDALNKSWETKFNTTKTELETKLAQRDTMMRNSAINGFATKLAHEISTSPGLMERVIRERLACDLDGDVPTVKILGQDGKPSALTTEDFKKELLSNKEFASILIGSRASGSATKPPPGSARTTIPQDQNPNVKLADRRGPSLIEGIKASRAAREALREDRNADT